VLGLMNLVDTARRPLADDDPGTMLVWAGALLAGWTAVAVAATWRTVRIVDAVKAGAVLGLATILVFHAAAIVRVNVFLDQIRYRADWQNLVARFQHSGFRSLRAYANYEYGGGTPTVVLLGLVAGSVSGLVAGLLNGARRALGR
jgi:hypothetical protein